VIAKSRENAVLEEQRKLEASPGYQERLKKCEEDEMLEMKRNNHLWLQREKTAQDEWQRKQKENEEKRTNQELKENAILLEWEALKFKEAQKKKERESKINEERKLQVKGGLHHYFFNSFYVATFRNLGLRSSTITPTVEEKKIANYLICLLHRLNPTASRALSSPKQECVVLELCVLEITNIR